MRIAVPFLALLVILAGAAPAAVLADTDSLSASAADDQPALSGSSVTRIDAPTVTELYIEPDPDGNARWTVSVRYSLESDSDRAAFREYGRSFEAGDAEAGPGIDFFRMLSDEAGSAAGRQMTIRNHTRNATIQNETGVLNLSFTWTNFVTDTERGFEIRESVLMPGNRTWLSSIGPSQRLVVETPEDYQVTDSRFGLDNGSVVVEGPYQFREPLTISYQETENPEPSPSSIPWALLVGALLLLGGVAGVVYARSRGVGLDSLPTTDDDGGDGQISDATADAEPRDVDEPVSVSEDDRPGPEDDSPDPDTDVDPELLSDEERVEHLLDQNGGRMKQARIVQETGWSDAKVSQLLSTMADDGRIEKLRLGRENLISLPDDES